MLPKGVGEGGGGAAGACAPALSKVGGGAQVGLSPPTFGKMKCSNFAISSFFKLKMKNFLGSLRSPT